MKVTREYDNWVVVIHTEDEMSHIISALSHHDESDFKDEQISGNYANCDYNEQLDDNMYDLLADAFDEYLKEKVKPSHVCGLAGFGVGIEGLSDVCPRCELENNKENSKDENRP